MPRPGVFLELAPASGPIAAHFVTRVRFRKARPRVHLPPWLGEDAARAFASMLRRTAHDGYAIEWMPAATGTGGTWRALLELVDDALLEVALDETDVDQALARAATLARKARERRLTSKPRDEQAPEPETFEKYAERWRAAREGRAIASADESLRRLRRHVFPTIGVDGVRLGDRPIAEVTREQLEQLVEVLDAKARTGSYELADGRRESFGWRMAIHVWSDVTTLFADAQNAKAKALRARPDNPCDGVHGPDRGARKAKVYLWPSEFLAFVSCDAVPLRWRRLVALSVYLYVRPGELAALEWSDVDLRHGTVHVHRSIDRVRKRAARATKTESARKIPIEPELLPLLRAMHRESGGKGPLVSMPSTGSISARFRELLERAGVRRPDLHHADATRKPVTWYDTRATGITWAAVRGDDHLRIMQRAGHEGFQTTMIYIREAENLGRTFGQVFPALPLELLGDQVHDARGDRGGEHPDSRSLPHAVSSGSLDQPLDHATPGNSKTPDSSEVSWWALQDLKREGSTKDRENKGFAEEGGADSSRMATRDRALGGALDHGWTIDRELAGRVRALVDLGDREAIRAAVALLEDALAAAPGDAVARRGAGDDASRVEGEPRPLARARRG